MPEPYLGDYLGTVANFSETGDRFGPIDFDVFHREDLPARLADHPRVFTAADSRTVRPIAFRLEDGRSYTYEPAGSAADGGGIDVIAGDSRAHTVVDLSYDDWCSFAWELRSCFALFYADRLAISRGSFGSLARWEPALRVAFDGQPIYDLDDPPEVIDASGEPLDLSRRFSLDDLCNRAGEAADFLERAGFVHLSGVVDRGELDRISADVTEALSHAKPEDRRSWWTTVDGEDTCNRVNYLNEHSSFIAGLGEDERFRRIGALGGPDLRDAPDRLDGNSVVIKVPGADSGLADLPWHRDCGMGGHPVKCPMLNIGIQLDAATAAAGQLLMIAGSHRGISRLPGPDQTDSLPVVALTTDPGDVTVHFGHTLHAAPPPSHRNAVGRRALYLSYVPPLTFEMIGPGQGYNDVLFTRSAGHIRHVDDLGAASSRG
jgi:hypothetical protein